MPAATATSPVPTVPAVPTGRAFFADERGVVLRSTWYAERGFLNLSIWKDASCVATFHLQVADVARFASFLVEGLGKVATEAVAHAARAEQPARPAEEADDEHGSPLAALVEVAPRLVRSWWRRRSSS